MYLEFLGEMAVVFFKLLPAIAIGLTYVGALVWQGYRVATAPGLWKLNAAAILATTALLFLPPYEGYAALSRAVNVSMLPAPFLFAAVLKDPGYFRLLPLAQLGITCFIFFALVQGAR